MLAARSPASLASCGKCAAGTEFRMIDILPEIPRPVLRTGKHFCCMSYTKTADFLQIDGFMLLKHSQKVRNQGKNKQEVHVRVFD